VYSSIIININDLDIIVSLISVYFEYIEFYVKYLQNILCLYYDFIHTLLIYFKKLLQMTYYYYTIIILFSNY